MATKKSTPKKTNTTRAPRGEAQRSTKSKASSIARTAGKGFAAGLNSTLGPDPKPYSRVQRSNPRSQNKPIDRRADGTLVTEPPKSNRKRFLPVDHGAAGELPTGATSAKYDSYTGKFVPVYESGSKKNSKKDLPRDYGL